LELAVMVLSAFVKNELNSSVNFRSQPSTFAPQQPKDGSSLRLIPLSILPCHWSCGLSLLVHFTYIYQHCTRPRIRSHTRGTAASFGEVKEAQHMSHLGMHFIGLTRGC
jgi:hypothetical protein